ncbi:MAG: HupE/UreJ family protein [Burkholderiales bacterium]|nr:HupE/UreJ family protein [Burkholderiales bacterium]
MNLRLYFNTHRFGARLLAGGLTAGVVPAAFAHHMMDGQTPATFEQGLLSGLAHPVIDIDHLFFLVVAIFLTTVLRGTHRWLAPLAFVVATIAGTAIHLEATNLPLAEVLVATSIILGAVLVLARLHLRALALSGFFALSGLVHGYVYGESIVGAEPTPLVAYLLGFALVQYAVIALGAFAIERLGVAAPRVQTWTVRLASVAALAVGTVFMALRVA